jgi:hypothetical protein
MDPLRCLGLVSGGCRFWGDLVFLVSFWDVSATLEGCEGGMCPIPAPVGSFPVFFIFCFFISVAFFS